MTRAHPGTGHRGGGSHKIAAGVNPRRRGAARRAAAPATFGRRWRLIVVYDPVPDRYTPSVAKVRPTMQIHTSTPVNMTPTTTTPTEQAGTAPAATDRTSRVRGILRAATLAVAMTTASAALAQYQVGNNGQARDANNRIGSNGINDPTSTGIRVNGNQIVTNNVTGGQGFR